MSSKSYARKAQRFVISNPTAPASPAQVKSCNWLLRSRTHSVQFGNAAIETLANDPKRVQCDAIIKHLSKCPSVARKTPVERKAEVVKTTDAVIAEMARKGKLGKVAQRKALAIA